MTDADHTAQHAHGARPDADPTDGTPHGASHASGPGASPECAFCPVCVLLQAMTTTRPEVTGHLLAAGRELSLALAAVLGASAETFERAATAHAERSATGHAHGQHAGAAAAAHDEPKPSDTGPAHPPRLRRIPVD